MALESLNPAIGVAQSASPMSSVAPQGYTDVMPAIANVRSSAGDIDGFNAMLLQRLQSANAQPDLSGQVSSMGAALQAHRAKYQQGLEDAYNPKAQSALDWQAIGKMGTAMMQPATNGGNAFANGAQAFQNARDANQVTLDQAQKEAEVNGLTNSKENYASALAQQALQKSEKDTAFKEALDYRKEMYKNKGANVKTVTDQTGAVYTVDPISKETNLILNSNGLTPQDGTSLGEYYKTLVDRYKGDMGEVNRQYTSEVAKRQAFNRKQISGSESPVVGAPDSQQPIFGAEMSPADIAIAKEDFKRNGSTIIPDKNTKHSIFSNDELTGTSSGMPSGLVPEEQTAWLKNQEAYTTEAMKDESAARANLSQTQAMYDSSKSALAIGAKTGAVQPFLNGFGAVMQSLGLQGTLSEEAIKGKSFEAIANQAVQVMQNAAKGAQTEGDATRFKESLVGVKNPAEANALILKFMEAQLWKREQEMNFRTSYSENNRSPAGASSKWAEWNRTTPTIQQINGKPVVISDFIQHMIQANPKAVESHGADYVKAEAIKTWRKMQK